MKIIKLLFYFLVLNMVFSIVNAADVCVVVYYPDETADSECVNVEENADGKEVLDATSFDVLWTPESIWGQMICRINGIGTDVEGTACHYEGEFWNFVLKDENKWGHSPVGLNGGDKCWNKDFSWSDWTQVVHYCAQDNDLIGFAFGEAGSEPNMLKIKNIEVYVDGDKEKSADESGGKVDNVNPESNIKLRIEVENLYSKDTNIKINNIIVSAKIKDIDEGNDLEEEADEFELDAGSKKAETVKFDIPLEVEENDYDLDVEIEGTDDNNIKYKRIVSFTVEVEKEKHNIMIKKAELTNSKLKCSRRTQLDIEVVNLGTEKENVNLEISNAELGINIKEYFNLDNDPFDDESKFKKTYLITIPNEQREGEYPLKINAVYNSESEEKIIALIIEGCKEIKEEENNPKITSSVIESLEVSKNQVIIPQEHITEEKSILKNLPTFSILLTIEILFFVLITRFIIKIFRK